jgi:isoleucyl-tRNA synthetase
MFRPVTSKLDVQGLEQEQLEFWKERNVFQRTTSERADGPRYVFYEGPPTANGRPGSHHVLARAFKDMFPRYKIMNGYRVNRKGGWDTHGLPVEIEVEKELGISYPTVKARLDALLNALSLSPVADERPKVSADVKRTIIEQLEKGEITAEEAKARMRGEG